MIKFDKVIVLKRLEDGRTLKYPAVKLEKSYMLELEKPTSRNVAPYLFIPGDVKSQEKIKLETVINEDGKIYETYLEYIVVDVMDLEEYEKQKKEKKNKKSRKEKEGE